MKNIVFLFVLLLFACKQNPIQYTAEIQFETMGTFGMVKLVHNQAMQEEDIASGINNVLESINKEFSTYIPNSTISKLNAIEGAGQLEVNDARLFCEVYMAGFSYYQNSDGHFNYRIKPLVDYYKSVSPESESLDSTAIDSLARYVGQFYELICDNGDNHTGSTVSIAKTGPMQLDFSAFAKGYGVDVVAYYLDSLGIDNYMVEIGGEVHCKGKNAEGNFWRLGIEEPNEETRTIYEVVQLDNKSMATSGNYRNFKVLENGQKVVHIINPKTGYPEISNLLSASIVADDCMSADAYATACMVMGVDTCFQFLLNHPELEGYLIYSDENGDLQSKLTEGFKKMIVE